MIVDNTFAPLICRPIDHGASLVVHSVTKMIGGHSDLTLGAVVGEPSSSSSEAKVVASTLGQTGNPFESWLALRGLATLSLRFKRACDSALELARRFESHGRSIRVYYPGLPEPPRSRARARACSKGGFGAIVTIDLGSRAKAESFIKALRRDSVRPEPGRRADDAQPSRHDQPSRARRRPTGSPGITPGMVRISVGIEDAERPVARIPAVALETLPTT